MGAVSSAPVDLLRQSGCPGGGVTARVEAEQRRGAPRRDIECVRPGRLMAQNTRRRLFDCSGAG
jgi:hypothetical protein